MTSRRTFLQSAAALAVPAPYLQQWNLTLQRALPARWVVSASYTGNHGVKLFGGGYQLNQLDPANLSLGPALDSAVPNPFFGQIEAGTLSNRTVSRRVSLVPMPDYLNVSMTGAHGASSIYHSLQATVEKRYTNGLSALVSYTNAKLIDDATANSGSATGMGDFRIGAYNRRLDRAIDRTDISQRMVISGVYELPLGRGKRWLSGAGPWRQVAGGWQVNAITTLETGMPLPVRGANNLSNINWPDVVRDPTLPVSKRTVDQWFDTEAFRNPADYAIGNVSRNLPTTRGPGLIETSLSAFKVIRIREKVRLEVKVESFNTLNHVNLNDPNATFSPNRQGLSSNATFGRCTSALQPRRMQFGMRLSF